MIHAQKTWFTIGLLSLVVSFATACSGDNNSSNNGGACEVDDDCVGDFVCNDGTCQDPGAKACEVDTDCGPNEYCNAGTCADDACADDSECGPGAICANDSCRAGCRSTDDCTDGELCNGNTLTCETGGCMAANCNELVEDCEVNNDGSATCVPNGNCRASRGEADCAAYASSIDAEFEYICDSSGATSTCVIEPECESDADCDGVGDICDVRPGERNICRPGCRSNDDCFSGEFCDVDGEFPQDDATYDDFTCVQGCITGDDCNVLLSDPNGQYICRGIQCIPVCESVDDCDVTGQTCRNQNDDELRRTCGPCTDTSQCPPNEFCNFDLITDEESGEPDAGLCRPLPPDCPDDGYGDNIGLDSAYMIADDALPFMTGMMMNPEPLFCDENSQAGEWFKFEAGPNEVIDISLAYENQGANLDLALKDSNGQDLVVSAEPPDRDEGTEALRYGTLAQSTFYVQVRGSVVAKRIPYSLSISAEAPPACTDDQFEENDTQADAEPVSEGMLFENLQVCSDGSGGDEDWYSFEADANRIIEVNLNYDDALGKINMFAYDPQGQPLNSVLGGDTIFIEAPDAGVYTLEVEAQRINNIDYSLTWKQTVNNCADVFEVNDTCGNATQFNNLTVGPGGNSFPDLNVCPDSDWYEVELLPLQTIRATATYNALESAGLIDLRLRGPNQCTTIASFDTRTRDPNNPNLVTQTLNQQVNSGGTFYVTATLDQGRQVGYDLNIEIIDGPPCQDDSLEGSEPTVISRADAVNGDGNSLVGLRICDRDTDTFNIDLQDGDTIRWVVKHQVDGDGNGNLDATITAPDGTTPASGTSTNTDEEVSYTVPMGGAGTYTLTVEGASPTRTDYNLLTYITPDGGTEVGPVDPNCPDPFEQNDTRMTAASITAGTYNDLLVCPQDDDYYKTTLAPGSSVTFTVDNFNPMCMSNPPANCGNLNAFIYDSLTGTPVDTSQSLSGVETVSYTTDVEREVYALVSGFLGAPYAVYRLDVDITPPAPCSDDNNEPNNTGATATTLETPGVYTRQFKCDGDEDWYAITVTENQQAEVFVNYDSEADITLSVFEDAAATSAVSGMSNTTTGSTSFVFTARDDSATGPSDPQTEFTYYVQVDTDIPARLAYDVLLYRDIDGDGSFGAGEGTPDRACPDPLEDNDDRSEAVPASSGASFEDNSICRGGGTIDTDWYEIFVPNGAELEVTATFDHNAGDLNIDLYEGNSFIQSANSSDDDETLTYTNNTGSGSVFFVNVNGRGTGYTNYYNIDFALDFGSNCPEDSVSGDDLASAPTTSATFAADVALCESTEDWFALNLGANEDVMARIELDNRFGNVDVELQDSTGAVVASSVTDDNIESIDYTTASAGTYYLRVFPRGGLFIRQVYDLWLALGANTPAAPYCPDPYERNDGRIYAAELANFPSTTVYEDAIACGADSDWYAFDTAAAGEHRFDVFFDQSADVNLDVTLLDDSGNPIPLTNGTGTTADSDEFVSFSANAGDTYYVGVENVATGNPVETPYVFYLNRASGTCPEDMFEPNNAFGTAALLMANSDYTVLGNCGTSEADYFEVAPVNAGPLTITAVHNPDDVTLELRSFLSGNNVGTQNGSRITITETVTPGDVGTPFTFFVQQVGAETDGPYLLKIEN